MSRLIRALGLMTVSLVAIAMFGVWIVPQARPETPTAQRYQDSRGTEAARMDSLRIASPPSVLAAVGESATTIAEATSVPLTAPVERIVIAGIDVDARVVEKGITPDGALDVPDSPELVAWYGFTGKPGSGGNAVMSAHLDYHNYGPAVFWNLKRLLPGDRIEIALEDGGRVAYAVTAAEVYPVRDVPMRDVLQWTERESLTLITCAGSFIAGEYTHRLVVRAVRVE
jgi:sortase A